MEPDALMLIWIQSFAVKRHFSDQSFPFLTDGQLFWSAIFVILPSLLPLHIFDFPIQCSLLSDSLISQVVLQGVFHEHATGHGINRLPMNLFHILNVGAERDFIGWCDAALVGNQTNMAHLFHCSSHCSLNIRRQS